VVLGLLLTVWGGYRRWAWIKNSWFRACHLAAIVIVVLQSWVGIICPLTTLEMWLRRMAGGDYYDGGFIQYWLHRLLFFDAPLWVFVLAYSLFGGLVLLAWFRFPPNFMRRG